MQGSKVFNKWTVPCSWIVKLNVINFHPWCSQHRLTVVGLVLNYSWVILFKIFRGQQCYNYIQYIIKLGSMAEQRDKNLSAFFCNTNSFNILLTGCWQPHSLWNKRCMPESGTQLRIRGWCLKKIIRCHSALFYWKSLNLIGSLIVFYSTIRLWAHNFYHTVVYKDSAQVNYHA